MLGLVGLALTLCIIAGEIDLSIGSNAALAAVIVVRFTDQLGAPTAALIAIGIAGMIGLIQGYFIAYLRIRAIVLTVGTLMLLRGVALFAAEEKTVMLTDFTVPDFITTKMLVYFSPASLLVILMFVLVGTLHELHPLWPGDLCDRWGKKRGVGVGHQSQAADDDRLHHFRHLRRARWRDHRSALGNGAALGLQYLLLAGTVAAFIGGVSILGGRGGVIGAAIGTLTVNFLNTGLVFNVTPAFMVQLYLGILLMIVIMFQTGSRMFDAQQRRKQILNAVDHRRDIFLARKRDLTPVQQE